MIYFSPLLLDLNSPMLGATVVSHSQLDKLTPEQHFEAVMYPLKQVLL